MRRPHLAIMATEAAVPGVEKSPDARLRVGAVEELSALPLQGDDRSHEPRRDLRSQDAVLDDDHPAPVLIRYSHLRSAWSQDQGPGAGAVNSLVGLELHPNGSRSRLD